VKREFQALERALKEFVEQPDFTALVIAAADNDVVMPSKILDAFDRQRDDLMVLSFPFECTTAAAYVDQVVQQLNLQSEAAGVELAAEGRPLWPALPLEAADSRRPVALRIRALVDWVAASVGRDTRIAWGLLPATILDSIGWRELAGAVLPLRGVEPWMEQHRFVIRDLHDPRLLIPDLEQLGVNDALTMEIDFGPEQMLDSLVRTASDKSLPKAERMDALFQLAAVDASYKRLPDALQKYQVLYTYYDGERDELRKGLCLGGAGDVHLRAEDPVNARVRYRQALATVVPLGNLGATLPLLLGAGESSAKLGDWPEAEGYYDYASQTAGKLFNPWAKCDALEQLGLVRWRQQKYHAAVEAWTSGKNLAKQFGYTERRLSILDQMIAVYEEAQMWADVQLLRTERASVEAGSA
jgi:tetratricopeptide (TPR) repeat protein